MNSPHEPAPEAEATLTSEAGPRRLLRQIARYLPALALIGIVGVVFALNLDRYATFDALREHHQLITAFVEQSLVFASIAYVGAYVAMTSLSLPWASLLSIAGGLVFGSPLATGLTVVGATAGSVVVYWFARNAFEGTLHDKVRRLLPAGRLDRVEAGFRKHALAYMLALRLAPIFPFVVVNLVSAFLAVPMRPFVIGTAIGIIPGTFVYTLLGAGLGDAIAQPDAHAALSVPPSLIGALFGMAILAIVPIVIRHVRRS